MIQMKPEKMLRILMWVTTIFTFLALSRILWVMKIESISVFQPKWLTLVILVTFIAIMFFTFSWRSLDLLVFWSNFNKRVQETKVLRILTGILFFVILIFYSWLFLFSPVRGFLAGNINSAATWYQGNLYLTDVYAGQTAIKSGAVLSSTTFQWWIFWMCGLIAAVIAKVGRRKLYFGIALVMALIFGAVIYKIANGLMSISSNPFSLTWQEHYRLYYASLLAAKRLYGVKLPLSLMDLSLNLLNGIPFIIGDFPIWVHRGWQMILSFGLTTLTGWALTRRLKVQGRLLAWLITGWMVLYFLCVVEVKYNLLICVLFVLLGFSPQHPWWTLVSILAASFWAGLSRINWFPVPAMLGIALYLLEESAQKYRNIGRYLLWPVIWFIAGVSIALIANGAQTFLSETNSILFGSVFNSKLLWYRLLPNPTYPLGVLPAVLIVSLPLWWVCFLARGQWHPIRAIGLASMILVLFAGGLVASVKIGGGGDLHNMDAYFVLMGIVSAYIFFQRYILDGDARIVPVSWLVLVLVLAFPIWSAVKSVQPYFPYNRPAIEKVLQVLQNESKKASVTGEVLFMYQKQLLPFGYVDVPLVPEYENIFLMEMVMSQNDTYLAKFYKDLCKHRFSLIVSDGQPKSLQGKGHGFGEENDAWFTMITQPLLRSYQLQRAVPEAGVELYVPRQDGVECNLDTP